MMRLVEVIPALTEQHRKVLLASAIDGASYEEIAETMGCELGTVRSSLFRAREKLRELIGEELYSVCAAPDTPCVYLSLDTHSAHRRYFEQLDHDRQPEERAKQEA